MSVVNEVDSEHQPTSAMDIDTTNSLSFAANEQDEEEKTQLNGHIMRRLSLRTPRVPEVVAGQVSSIGLDWGV